MTKWRTTSAKVIQTGPHFYTVVSYTKFGKAFSETKYMSKGEVEAYIAYCKAEEPAFEVSWE